MPRDSQVSQLSRILYEIESVLDVNTPAVTCEVFLDISKASDKVKNEGLLFKLRLYGGEHASLKLLEKYLSNSTPGLYFRTHLLVNFCK